MELTNAQRSQNKFNKYSIGMWLRSFFGICLHFTNFFLNMKLEINVLTHLYR